MKKEIKINFVDFFKSFNKLQNPIMNLLSKHYNVQLSDKPDFLFCSCFGAEHEKYKNCVKIFDSGENILPDFNVYDYGSGFDYLDFGDRYFRKIHRYPTKEIQNRSFVSPDMAKRRFCNFIYSNDKNGEGSELRKVFCQKLMQYKQVDCPGKVLNNMQTTELEPRDGLWQDSKIDFLKKYKFTIAFENSSSVGYTTEKLYHPFFAGSIPIYWGNPKVTDLFNPKAFINCNDYNNDLDAVIQKVIELDKNPKAYLKMLSEPPMRKDYDFDYLKKYENWLCAIIEKGNHPFNKDPLHFSEKTHTGTLRAKTKLFGLTLFSVKRKDGKFIWNVLGIKWKTKER